MEEVAVSKMQAVQLAKTIVEARDAELAFLLQVQEIVKSYTSNLPEHEVGAGEDSEDPSQQILSVIEHTDSQIASDIDKGAALNLAVDDLGSFVEEIEETQLSLLEAARLAHLDAIQEHDAHFARSLANMPRRDWDRIGCNMADPFTASSGPRDPLPNKVDEYEAVLSLLQDASNLTYATDFTRSRRRRCRGGGGMRNLNDAAAADEAISTMQRAITVSATPLTIREIFSSTRYISDTVKQQEKGKEKVLQEEDANYRFAASQVTSGSSLSIQNGIIIPKLFGGLRHERDAIETDMNAGDDSPVKICQICFEATQTTSTFVTLEGCGHEFCETCVTRHAEARIVDGGQMHVTCLHAECSTIISFTQLSSLLSSGLLDVLTRRQIEAAIPESERMYCPFQDCSALLIKPSSHTDEPSSSAHPPQPIASDYVVECEICHREFCLECAVPWHDGMSCADFNGNLKNLRLLGDKKLLQLADQQKWQRCRKCGQLVELTTGCYHMTCVCKHEFCYTCGESWKGGAKACSCERWDVSRL